MMSHDEQIFRRRTALYRIGDRHIIGAICTVQECVHKEPMADVWSREEVEATVADYFGMLNEELHGRGYNKSQHRRRLARLLDGRTEAAIERKHQNISAILIELGFVYIVGYKPLRNYQALLFESVADRLAGSEALSQLVRSQVSQPAQVPNVDNILNALVDPPVRERDQPARERPAQWQASRVDYVAMEANNRSLGAAGEEFVVRFERARLIQSGNELLANKVERVSETRGDGLGFDVLSFETSGRERLIEVKTTAYGPSTPFFVTRNEVNISQDAQEQFHLYRAFTFRTRPRLFSKQGAIDQSFSLEPSAFEATII